MRLAILGGGGFRVPLVYGALLGDPAQRRVDEVVLHDTDPERLAVIATVLADQASAPQHAGRPPVRVRTTTSLEDAVAGADFVFSAIRVGGLAGRVADERVALDLGLLGQETTGPGGLAYGLRTIPVATDIAELVRRVAPDAWVINFTNPAGMVTEAMQAVLGDRVVGICDSPLGLAARCARTLGVPLAGARVDYSGLNHLGWLQGLEVDGTDVLTGLLDGSDAARDRLRGIEEGQLFGPELIERLQAVPNEYLYYYERTAEAVAAIKGSGQTRGEYLLGQQDGFYAALRADAENAWQRWESVRLARNATYLQEARAEDEERAETDIEGGGYEGVALALMGAIARDEPATLILNVRGRGAVDAVPGDAVVEVPCRVDAAGPVPLPVSALTGRPRELVGQVKTVERLAIRAAREGDPDVAVEAFAAHPLVGSGSLGEQLLRGYRSRIPTLDAVFAGEGH